MVGKKAICRFYRQLRHSTLASINEIHSLDSLAASYVGWIIPWAMILQHCHIIRDSEPQIVSRTGICARLSLIWNSDPISRPAVGFLCRPRPIPGMNPAMACLCVLTITSCLMDMLSSYVSSPMWVRSSICLWCIHKNQIRKFVFVNYFNDPMLQQCHGKAIALDIRDPHAPFPSLFIIHEMRVRGFHPFEPTQPAMADDAPWQDWILLDGVFDNASGSFKRDSPPDNGDNGFSAQSQPQFQPTTMSTGDAPSGGRRVTLNADVVADILAATYAMPSWKACQVDGTSWTGTAQENIQKYVSSIGAAGHWPPMSYLVDRGGSRKPILNLQDGWVGWMSVLSFCIINVINIFSFERYLG